MLKTIFAISAFVLVSSTSTMAQQREVWAQEIRGACGDVPAGGGRIRSCLNSHLADLPEPCRIMLISAAAAANECSADIRTVCANVQTGGGRIAACLQSHMNELSATCVDVMRTEE